MRKKSGFTLIELMIGLIILSLLLTASWRIFSGGKKNVDEVMANHMGNQEVELIIMRMTNEIRQANVISQTYPKFVLPSEVKNLQTNSPDNRLEFITIDYDFATDPSTLPAGEVNYIQKQIKYYLDSEDPAKYGWTLYKETEILDSKKQVIESETSIYPILEEISHCVFYRLKDSANSRLGSVYLDVEFSRKDSPYTTYSTMAAKERSACPEY